MRRHINRFLPVTILLLLGAVGCAGSAGTGGTAGSGQAASTTETAAPAAGFQGLWEGTLSLSEGNASASMRFTPEGSGYDIQASVNYQGQGDNASVSRVTFEGERCTFWMGFDTFGVEVLCKSRLQDGKLTGTIEVYEEGMLVDEGIFTMVKR